MGITQFLMTVNADIWFLLSFAAFCFLFILLIKARREQKDNCLHPAKRLEILGPAFIEPFNDGYRHAMKVKCKCCRLEFELAYFSYLTQPTIVRDASKNPLREYVKEHLN